MNGPEVHGDTRVRVLAAVLGGARSVREVQAETGRSVSTIHGHLLVLEKAGLVAWDRGRHRTLRPTVRAVK